MILETITMWLLAAFISGMLGIMYYGYTDYMDIPNGFEVIREIIGGYMLAAALYIEEREERSDEFCSKSFGLSM